ncbi:endonuclease/exonuclease/phosphatase family protein [Haloferax sp. S1W]|uniref:endonuclease/exonuclease/phosphatase family protein n=1 Tax=Haloferax sp. S1W TaxID=3377110 RepID=UPI0037C5C57B
MSSLSDTPSRWTRRTVLRCATALPFAASVAGTAHASPSGNARIATLNLGLGVSLAPLLSASDEAELQRIVGELYKSVEASAVSERMGVLADELLAVAPDVVALQEASSVYATGEGTIDFLAELTAALNEGPESYRVAAVSETSAVSLPGVIDGTQTTVSLHDKDAVLVREGVEATELRNETFDATLEVVLGEAGDRSVDISRGFSAATVAIPDGPSFTIASTHLERASRAVRVAQAAELTDWANGHEGPVAIVGDTNSKPGGEAYEGISASFAPVTADIGPTCCRRSNLTGGDLDRTVDHVFVRGLTTSNPTRFAHDDAIRVETPAGNLWPSDHAGVAVTVEAAPEQSTATPTDTTTRTASTTQPTTPSATATTTNAAGFGLLASLSALVAAALRTRQSE